MSFLPRKELPAPHHVQLVRWPAEASVRHHCQAHGIPRLLVVEAGAHPPTRLDPLEDWVRQPISRQDLQARMEAVSARLGERSQPHLDPSGLIRFRGRSTTITMLQTGLLELLVDEFQRIVTRAALLDQLAVVAEGQPTRNALDLHIMRLRRRIGPLDLGIATAWGRGYVLEPSEATHVQAAPILNGTTS